MTTNIIARYLKEIADKAMEIEMNNKKINNSNILLAYRGEPKDYGRTKLMPSLFRENEYVSKEKYLFELLGDYNVIESDKKRYIEKAIEAQHYVAISRVLDITFSVLPALFFACQSEEEQDAIFYIFGFPKHFSPHSTYIEDAYKNIFEDDKCIYDKNFRVITHSRYNERIFAQSGGFIFFPGKKHCPISTIYYEEIPIRACDKKDILQELQIYFDITEEKLFPDKNNDAKSAKRRFSEAKLYDEQNKINIKNEIELYFERIDYEMEMMKTKGILEKESFFRIIRKEKADLMFFLKNLENKEIANCNSKDRVLEMQNEYVALYRDVNRRFELIRRSK